MPKRGNRALHIALGTTSIVLPTLSLLPLGSLWLWENGYLLQWAAAAFLTALVLLAVQWWLLRPPAAEFSPLEEPADRDEPAAGADREALAWRAVQAYAASLTPEAVKGESAVKDLARDTINAVARQMHPGQTNPIWNFTVPEALALAERVAARLRPIVVENVPLGDQLTVKQVLRLYEWRVAVDWAERAYDVWRILRLINPATAITHEARERLTKKVYASLRDEFTVRVAQGYVREVGRAAIDLYGGRLRTLAEPGPAGAAAPAPEEPPLHPHAEHKGSGFKWRRLARQARNLGSAGAEWLWHRRSQGPPK